MAAGSSEAPDGLIADINVTPLVDITLVLLIIFMVTAKVMVAEGLLLDLPPAARPLRIQPVFGVELRADGRMLIDGKPIARLRDVRALAQESLRRAPEQRAVIRAEKDVRHGRVIGVIDALQQAGMSHIAFAVTRGGPADEAEP